MKHLSLRIRIFLFFLLIAAGSLGVTALAIWVGFRQLGDPAAASAFLTTGIIGGFGITGLVTLIWLLFDDNVSKPVERIAAGLRVRTHVKASTALEVDSAKYLGDLAPAASAMGAFLDRLVQSRDADTQDQLAQITTQRDQLVDILSDLPIATILASEAHRIVLYDGQAATVMDRVTPARLETSVFDYFDETAILAGLDQLERSDTARREITITSHCGRIYAGHLRRFERNAGYTLMLDPKEHAAARPLTFDFELLRPAATHGLADTPLHALVFVVFDTETTGLNPVTDEVVQLGAVRVVNRKIVSGEVLDTLVNPGIAIPRHATDIHGISPEDVATAPRFKEVCDGFHRFCTGAVLVAHNAAFDMAFLHRQSADNGPAFDQPVLDTVLMSAAIFGGSAVHTLDAICERLNITIPEHQRHTALGDATATAQALVAMIAIFEARGISTYAELQAETDKHRRALKA